MIHDFEPIAELKATGSKYIGRIENRLAVRQFTRLASRWPAPTEQAVRTSPKVSRKQLWR